MKSVLISIQPKWCEKIKRIIGQKDRTPIYEKTVEIRKNRPKIETPFKCYIYETQALYKGAGGCLFNGIGKVIGEFVCDSIQAYESEFVDDDCFESIASLDYEEETGFIEWSNDSNFPYESIDLYKKSCVTYEELKKYIGLGFNKFYGWNISDLVIYDKPKELSEFHKVGYTETKESVSWLTRDEENSWQIKRPPQSWCYVEELKGGVE